MSGLPDSYIATSRSRSTESARLRRARIRARRSFSASSFALARSSSACLATSSASIAAWRRRRSETSPSIVSIAAFCSAIVALSERSLCRTWSSLPWVASNFSCSVSAGAESPPAAHRETIASSAAAGSNQRLW